MRRASLLASLLSLAAVVSSTGCDPADAVIPEHWVVEAPPTHEPRPMPQPSDEGLDEEGSLLASYADRSPNKIEELEAWMLPFQARAAIAELLILTADDDPMRLRRLMTRNARWGFPDRRQLQAEPIYTKDDPLGLEFLTAFRQATSRFKKRAHFNLEPLPGFEMFAATGAEPVWCSYSSDDGLDIIGIRMIVEDGHVKIDYIGFFVDRPTGQIRVPATGSPPPVIPYAKFPAPLTLPED